MKRSPIKRHVPLRQRRATSRRGEPTASDKATLRRFVYERAEGKCELGLKGCKGGFLPWDGDVFTRAHLVHLRARRRFGWGENNLALGCPCCHRLVHDGKAKLPQTYEELKGKDGSPITDAA